MRKEIIIYVRIMTDGGAERVLSELMEVWSRKGAHIKLVVWDPKYQDTYTVPKGVEIIDHSVNCRGKIHRALKTAYNAAKLFRSHSNASVLAFHIYQQCILAMISPFIHNRIIVSERCDPAIIPKKWITRLLRNRAYSVADACIFQTEEAANYYPPKVRSKGTIIPNPINPDLPDVIHAQRRKTVVTACRLAEQKNIHMLLKAFAKFSKEFPDYTLEIYGRGELEEELRAQIHRSGLENRARLMGFTHALYEKMRDCAMYVSSSNYEGISNSIMEALGLGLPTIATDCPAGGSRMLIKDGENGLLVPVGDVEALYQAMKRIAENPEFARKLSENAVKVRDEYKAETIAEKWLEIM